MLYIQYEDIQSLHHINLSAKQLVVEGEAVEVALLH
jgi:hypothetical protein